MTFPEDFISVTEAVDYVNESVTEVCLDNPEVGEEDVAWQLYKDVAWQLWHSDKKVLASEILRTQLGITPAEAGLVG